MLLVGDIGGTKTLLRLIRDDGTVARTQRFESPGTTLPSIIDAFLDSEVVKVAVFGVAGPVFEGRVATTNLPWQLDETVLARDCNIGRVKLLNDFEATAAGVIHVAKDKLATLHAGTPVPRAPIGVIGAGTGLGVAFLVWTGDDYVVVPTEGGHAEFAPRTDLEVKVMQFLRERHKRVSVERVVSGLGMYGVYEALRAAGVAPESEAVVKEMRDADRNAVIGTHAAAGDDPLCVATIDLFLRAYGSEAGNLALRTLARGGIYVTGGIAPKLLPLIQRGGFMEAFQFKGRLSPLVAQIPVHVVLDPEVPLVGALHVAQKLSAA